MPRARDRLRKEPRPHLVARSPTWQPSLAHEKSQVMELLEGGPARVESIAQHLGLGASSTHAIIRRLRDEEKVHADSGYWVAGPRRKRSW